MIFVVDEATLLGFLLIGVVIVLLPLMLANKEYQHLMTGKGYRKVVMALKSGGIKEMVVGLRSIKDGMWDWNGGLYNFDPSKAVARRTLIGGEKLQFFFVEGDPDAKDFTRWLVAKDGEVVSDLAMTAGMAKKRVRSKLREKWVASLGTDWMALMAVILAGLAVGGVALLYYMTMGRFDVIDGDNAFLKGAMKNATKVVEGGKMILPLGWIVAFNGMMRSGKTVSMVRQAYKDKYEEGFAVWACNIDDLKFADWVVPKPQDLNVSNVIEWKKRFVGITVVIAELATWFNSYNFRAESSQDFGLFGQQTVKGNVHVLYDSIRYNHGIKRLRDLTMFFVQCSRLGDPRDYVVPIVRDWCILETDEKLKGLYREVVYAEDYGQYFKFFDSWRLTSK